MASLDLLFPLANDASKYDMATEAHVRSKVCELAPIFSSSLAFTAVMPLVGVAITLALRVTKAASK